jgi:hypothetical protein
MNSMFDNATIFLLGVLTPCVVYALRAMVLRTKKLRLKCAWCESWLPLGSGGGVCKRCLEQNELGAGVAGPDDWPRS